MTTAGTGGSLRVGVLGAGGVGGLLAALLLRARYEVTVIANPATCESLTHRGLTVRSSQQFGTVTIDHVRCAPQLSEDVDVLFVAVKATGLESALERIPAKHLESALVLPLLNGIEHMEVLRTRYPQSTVSAAAIRVEATKVAAGMVEHHSPFARIELAEDDAPPLVRRCADMLTDAGLETTFGSTEEEVLWKKLAFLAPLALLTTCHGAPAGVVRTEHREDLLALTEEVSAVAEREQARLEPADALAFFDGLPQGMRSSMQKDAEAGRPTELEAIGGAVLRRAQRHGVDVPVTARYVALLRERELLTG